MRSRPCEKEKSSEGGPSLPTNKGMVDIRQKRGNAAKGTPQPEPHPPAVQHGPHGDPGRFDP